MKRPVTHNPLITFDQAGCTCRSWPGTARTEGEAIGAYTSVMFWSITVHQAITPADRKQRNILQPAQ